MPRSGIMESYDSFIFSFLRNLILFYIIALPIYIPTHSVVHHTFFSIYYLLVIIIDNKI